MAQKLLRKVGAKRKVAAKKAVIVEEKRNVLVGTYGPRQLEKWPDYYNYPLYGKDRIDVEAVKGVNELWLFSGAKLPRYFAAECLGVKTREELKEYGYKPSGKGHGSGKYLLFKITKLYAPSRDFAESVTIRTKDFAGQGATQKQLKAYLESPDRKDPLLAKMLPKIVTEFPRERLRVCEAAVQLDFFPKMLKPIEAVKIKPKPKFTFIDLFAGCGGLSLGLERAGFTPLLVNELNPDALSTYLLNRRDEFPWLCDNNVSNVKDLVLNEKLLDGFQASIKKDFGIDIYKGQLDLICGGPPCQGFSGLGIRRSYSVEKKQLPSNYLYQDMAFLINRIRPKIFLFENVRGLLSAKWTNDGEKGEIFGSSCMTVGIRSRHNLI